jgi:hypothetical protein
MFNLSVQFIKLMREEKLDSLIFELPETRLEVVKEIC